MVIRSQSVPGVVPEKSSNSQAYVPPPEAPFQSTLPTIGKMPGLLPGDSVTLLFHSKVPPDAFSVPVTEKVVPEVGEKVPPALVIAVRSTSFVPAT